MSKSILHITDFTKYCQLVGQFPCVVKFTAVWCGPCERMKPQYQALADEYCGKVNFLEIDIDHANQITNYEDVKSIPLFLFYLNGSKLPDFSLTGADPLKLKARTLSFITQIPEPVVSEPISEEPVVEHISEQLDKLHVCNSTVCLVSESTPVEEIATVTSELSTDQETSDEPELHNECIIIVPVGDRCESNLSKLVLDDIVESDTSGSESDEITIIDELSRHGAEEILSTCDSDEYGEDCELPVTEDVVQGEL